MSDSSGRPQDAHPRSMLDDSAFLGPAPIDAEDLAARIGYTDPPTHISTFSGIGGFDLGFHQAGFDSLVAIESDQDAADTYRLNSADWGPDNSPPVLMERDIREVSTWEILDAAGIGVGGVTVVTGGPPCQAFSHLNTDRDADDPRNELYLQMARIVHQAKPVFFVMENVPGLATMQDGKAIREVCETFAAGGYNVTWDILNAANFGVPQKRERVFVIGKRIDVFGLPETGRPQMHIGAKPGTVNHPEAFREKHDLEDPGQTTFDAFESEPETLDEIVEQAIQEGIETLGGGS